MRLGQLARKLALRPADIAEFLGENNIRIAEGANARLETDHVNLIMKRYVPGWIETPEVEPEREEEVIPITIGITESKNEPLISPELETEEQSQPAADSVQVQVQADDTDDTVEVIRAPKIELSGLKVVGKIDLPEQKKKEEEPKEESAVSDDAKPEVEKRERREIKRQFDGNKRHHQRPEKNPIALQREREEKETQKKRQEQIARDKEKRTQKYLQNYKPAPTTKAAKVLREDTMEMTAQELVEPPKTILGKFLRWLTS
ncbi:MAG TPA: hypothetical protein VK589_20150 [Chryseolinea sp.]|nr:hypothetical protein [Chryseolinea sp.]